MSIKEKLNCSCSCGNIQFAVKNKPSEIAQCYCNICQRLHENKFACFTRYLSSAIPINEIKSQNKLVEVQSSSRAIRYQCYSCQSWICMIYKNSSYTWLVTDLFDFDLSDIEKYDIYKDPD